MIVLFYDRLVSLCKINGIKPTPLLQFLGLSAGNLQKWQKGATVNSDILVMLCNYFGVSMNYFFEDSLNDECLTQCSNELNEKESHLLLLFNKCSEEKQDRIILSLTELTDSKREKLRRNSSEEKRLYTKYYQRYYHRLYRMKKRNDKNGLEKVNNLLQELINGNPLRINAVRKGDMTMDEYENWLKCIDYEKKKEQLEELNVLD